MKIAVALIALSFVWYFTHPERRRGEDTPPAQEQAPLDQRARAAEGRAP